MIFVTGGTGLVGTHLLYDLTKAGKKVRALKRSTSQTESIRAVFNHYNEAGDSLFDQIEWVEGDITDIFCLIDAMQGVDLVYHCAALVSFDPRDSKKLYHINVEGTANVVNAALECGIQKLCHVSSTAAIGKSGDLSNITESDQWKSSDENTNYAISKFGAEREVWRGTQEGLTSVIVNPSIIVGPGNWNQSSASVFKTVWDGLKFYTTGVNAFVDVRDVSKAMTTLMESTIDTERFLVIGENLSFRDFFTMVANSLGKKPPTIHANRFMTGLAWRVGKLLQWITGKTPAITKESARTAHNEYRYSNQKIKEAIGLEFTPIKASTENAGEFFLKQAR